MRELTAVNPNDLAWQPGEGLGAHDELRLDDPVLLALADILRRLPARPPSGGGTGTAVNTGDTITAAKMNLKLETLGDAEEQSTFFVLRFQTTGTLPAGTVAYVGADNTNDVTINALTSGTINFAVNGTDEIQIAVNELTILSGSTIDFNAAAGSAATLLRDVNNNELLQTHGVASAITYFIIRNAITGSGPILEAGGEANTDITLLAAGTGAVILDNGTDPVQLQFNGAAAGFNNEIVDLNGNEIVALQGVASAVNELTIVNAATGNSPTLGVQGETNVGLTLSTAGTGVILFQSATTSRAAVNNAYSMTLYQATANYTLAWANPSAARTITIPDPGGADSFAYLAATQTLTNKTYSGGTLSGTLAGTPTYSGNATYSGATITVSPSGAGTAVDTVINHTTSPILDIGADVYATGTFIAVSYDTAETLTGAVVGINLDLDTNVTLSNQAINGIIVTMPATYGGGAEVGVQVTGDGQTINIGNDADLYVSFAKASSVDVSIQGVSPIIDIGADVLVSGTFIAIDYDTAESTTGALYMIRVLQAANALTLGGDLVGVDMDFNANVTAAQDQDVTAYRVLTPALTQSGAVTTNYIGFNLPTAGALVQDTAAGTLNFYGVNIQLPNTTASTGTVTAYGLRVVEGTTTSGTVAAALFDGNVDTVIGLSTGPIIDIGADVFAAGTFIDIAYDTAETLTGAVIGININLNTNVTLSDQAINGVVVAMPAAYGTGAEVGVQVTGDGQTINIGNDADLYISLAKASWVDISIQGVSPVIDIGADVLAAGTFIAIDYDTAETTTGTLYILRVFSAANALTLGGDLLGVELDFNANVTAAEDRDITGVRLLTPALTQSGAVTTNYIAYNLPTAGALVQDTAGGTMNWRGVNIQMPNITQTTGTVSARGLMITEGTTTSGEAVGLWVDVDIAIDLVTIGNRIDLDADNDTSLRASADDVLTWEIAGTDHIVFALDAATAAGNIRAAGAVEIGIQVTNGSLTVGSAGSIVLPTNAGGGTDGVFGNLDGAIGFDLTNNTIEVRDTTWLTSGALTGYAIQSFVPFVVTGRGHYHPNQFTGVQLVNGQGIAEEYVDETICFICGELMEPGSHLESRAITLYPNAWLREDEPRRVMLHNIFGHAHPERDPVIQKLQRTVERLAARLGLDLEEALEPELVGV